MAGKSQYIFIADEFHRSGLDLLKKDFAVINLRGLSNHALISRIVKKPRSKDKTSALIIRSTRRLGAAEIRKIASESNIRLICTVSSGFDNIDISACRKHNIDVLNTPHGNTVSAGEFTFALILALSKNLISANSEMKSGIFSNSNVKNFELLGKTLGVIGVGRVGGYTARLGKAFGMKIIGNDIDPKVRQKNKWIKFFPLNYLLANSDVITLHVPLDDSTRNLIYGGNLKLLKKDSLLINCSRGGTVNEKSLIRALKNGKIRYGGIDVFRSEPGFDKGFTKLENVILTPHLAGKTVESRSRMSLQTAGNISRYYRGKRRTLKFVN